MPEEKDKAAAWWYPVDIVIGAVTGHFWAINHIAHNDGARDQTFTLAVAIAIVGGIGMGIFCAKLKKSGLVALCMAMIAFGVAAWFW